MVDSIAGPTVGHAKRREIDDSTPVIARFRHAGKYNHNFTTDFISIQASGIGLGGKRIHHNKMEEIAHLAFPQKTPAIFQSISV